MTGICLPFWSYLDATFPFAHCVLITLAFILILLTCQDYFLIAVPTSHDYLKCHFLKEAFFRHARRNPTPECYSILYPHYHSLKVSYSFICTCLPYSLLFLIFWISSWYIEDTQIHVEWKIRSTTIFKLRKQEGTCVGGKSSVWLTKLLFKFNVFYELGSFLT